MSRLLAIALLFATTCFGQEQLPWNRAQTVATLGAAEDPILFSYAAGDDVAAKGGTFTRTSAATYTDVNGVVQTAATGVIRDAHYINGVRTTLLEAQRTNLALRSQEFDNAAWTVTNSPTANAASAPDGTTTAEKLREVAGSSTHRAFQPVTLTAGTVYTWSVYAKAAERSWLGLTAHDGSENISYFDLSGGTTGANAAGNSSAITGLGNGWYRCSVTRTAAGTGGYMMFYIMLADSGTTVRVGDGSSGIYIWGADLEAGSSASSYILTTSATVTRAVDASPFTLASHADWTRWEWYYTTAGVLTETVTAGTGSYSWTPTVDRSYRRTVIAKGTRDAAFFAAYK